MKNGESAMQFSTTDFRAWFGNSKVVDPQGMPLLVYHGSISPCFTCFSDGPTHFGPLDAAHARLDYWMKETAPEIFVAGRVDPRDRRPAIFPVFLSIQNPKRVEDADHWDGWVSEMRDAKKAGHDGLVYTNNAEARGFDSYVVFFADQIAPLFGCRGAVANFGSCISSNKSSGTRY